MDESSGSLTGSGSIAPPGWPPAERQPIADINRQTDGVSSSWLRPAIAVIAIAVVFGVAALALTAGGSQAQPFTTSAASICRTAQASLRQLPSQPSSVPAALELEHNMLNVYGRELSQLDALRPSGPGAAEFSAGLADDRALLNALTWMIARPDYAHLAITLPGHPRLAPAWLKAWLARSQALQNSAQVAFSQARVPGCESSLG